LGREGVPLVEGGGAAGGEEGEGFAGGGETEVGVERLAGSGAVFVAGEDDEVGSGLEGGAGWERPAGGASGIVGEVEAAEVDGGEVGVMDFDPVGAVAVFVGDAGLVAGHEFRDERSGADEGCEEEGAQEGCPRVQRGAGHGRMNRREGKPASTDYGLGGVVEARGVQKACRCGG